MSKRNGYVDVPRVRELCDRAGVPLSVIHGLARVERQRQGGESKYETEKGLRLRTRPKPGSSLRLIYHEKDVRDAIAVIREAMDSGRSTTAEFWYRGAHWIPSLMAEREYGFLRPNLLLWNEARPGTRDCQWLGRKLAARLWLVRLESDKLRWVWFYKKADILQAKAAKDRGERVVATTDRAERAMKPKHETPNPSRWADTDEALKITGAKEGTHLFLWHKRGFAAGDGRRLPLGKQTFKVEGTRGVGKAFWRRDHALDIGAWRKRQKPVGEPALTPYDHHGVKLHRERYVLRTLKCSPNVLAKWAESCPSLGGQPFERIKIPSLHSTKPEEYGYRDDQFQRLAAIPPHERTWGRGRTASKPWLGKAPRDGRGRLQKIAGSLSTIAATGASVAGGGDARATAPPRRRRGRPNAANSHRREELLDRWERAKAAGVKKKDFCLEAGVSVKKFEAYQAWRGMQNYRNG